ncbi:MAG: hypothetical protein K6F63_07705 [Lachnospiraceae bacterium]|nr:hypothetical protein [Lachnospiraceae bacterium]
MTCKIRKAIFVLSAAAIVFAAGCENSEKKVPTAPATQTEETKTPTPDAAKTTEAPTSTPTPTVTNTPTPVPTATFTPSPTPTATNSPTPTPTKKPTALVNGKPVFPCSAYVDCYSLTLRSTADVREKLLKIYNGTEVTITGNSASSFYYECTYQGNNYTINKSYITFDEPFGFDYNSFEIVDPRDVVYSYSDMEKDIFELAEKYPETFSYYSAGKSPDKREMYVCTIGNPDAPKCIYITGTAHAREFCTSLLLMMQSEYYLKTIEEGYFKDVNYKDLFNEICFVLLPMQNPDGVDLCISGPSAIRNLVLRSKIQSMYDREDAEFYKKYGKHNSNFYKRWKSNAQGIDINRNYSFGWEETNDYPVPASSGYKGEEPFCATEVKIQIEVLNKLMEEKDLVFAISYHATGNDLSWEVEGMKGDFLKECKAAVEALVYVTDYEPNMNDMNLDKEVPLAGYTDWLNGEEIVPSITIEILPMSLYLAAEKPTEEEMQDAWVANRQVWAVLGELYYEGERR